MTSRIASNALIVLAGPSGAGKSTWAAQRFAANHIVSSDDLRAVVGLHDGDQRAATDAFAVLDDIVARRLKRGLLTVVDTLGTDAARRAGWREVAIKHQRPCHLIFFDVPAADCRKRNKARPRSVSAKVLTSQLERWPDDLAEVQGEPFTAVHSHIDDIAVVKPAFASVVDPLTEPASAPTDGLRFGLHVSAFDFAEPTPDRLADIAVEAEAAGFSSLWVMDHVVQIPQVGREWDPMLDCTTTLGFLAGRTTSLRLGTLVHGIGYRNIAQLGKQIATLDVLSGGRAMCGLGVGWFAREHELYDFDFLPVGDRYDRLADALELLPLLWGPGSPAFRGRTTTVPEAICYPRPVQERLPIMVGGSGEKRTLRLVAEAADACNLFGEPAVVHQRVAALHQHCEAVGRDPSEVAITHLSGGVVLDRSADAPLAGSVDDHRGRFGQLQEVGVQEAIVSLPRSATIGEIEEFAQIIASFS